MKFNKMFVESQVLEWRGEYIDYNSLKHRALSCTSVGFQESLRKEVEKSLEFLGKKKIELSGRVQVLKKQLENSRLWLETQFELLDVEEEMSNLEGLDKDFRDVGRELVNLLSFVEMNFIAVKKILKKQEKLSGVVTNELGTEKLLVKLLDKVDMEMISNEVKLGISIVEKINESIRTEKRKFRTGRTLFFANA